MAGTGTLTFSGQITGFPTGTTTFNSVISLTNAVDYVLTLQLTSGYNSVTVPSGATGVVIQPPFGNTVQLTLKGATGDTGIPMHKTNMHVQSLDSTATVVGITAATGTTGLTEFKFF